MGEMMTIKIVTDSTCDLPEAIIARYGITVVPLYINTPERGYLDGVELSRAAFYETLAEYDPPPTTASPGPEKFRQVNERLKAEGATEILSIHISDSLSGTVETARLGAKTTRSVPVTVLDSRQLSLGTGFVVWEAAKAARTGRSMAEILAVLEDQIQRTYVFAVLDTLEFLRRSGRMSWTVARLGQLLRIKPLLKMHDGRPTVERVRTHKKGVARLIELVTNLGPLDRLALVHTHAPAARIENLRQQAAHLFPDDEPPWCEEVTPVIGAHIGPGVVGFACIAAKGGS